MVGTKKQSKPLSAISLFTGAGGLDLGFEAAGFATKVAVECDPAAVATLRHNRDWSVIDSDIDSPAGSSANILKAGRLQTGEADILIGGPPCQPFSKSGYWARGDAMRLEDPRASTLKAYLRVLKDTLPRAFLLENVPGIAFSDKDEGLRLLRRQLESINRTTGLRYTFQAALLRAVEFGVPQDRHRVFVVGSRDGIEFEFPRPSHLYSRDGASQDLFFDQAGVKAALTAWDAIGDLQDDDDPTLAVTGKWADLLPTIPEGENYLFHTARGEGLPLFGWRRRYWSFLLKLAKSLPSWTIAAHPGPAIGPFHWKSRRLSSRELCRLQTFPDSFLVLGTLRTVQKQLGNAVPSALAERLALEIRAQFFGERQTADLTPTLIPRRRPGMPSEEKSTSVPKKYMALVGDHDPHPGTGKGFGALRRTQQAKD